MSYGISREQEHTLPRFTSHADARAYFKEHYGDCFQMMDSDHVNGQKVYFYKLILNKKAYYDMLDEIEKNGYACVTETNMYCTQDIQVFEDGTIHIVH